MDPFKTQLEAWQEQVNTAHKRTIQEADALMRQWSIDEKLAYALWVASS